VGDGPGAAKTKVFEGAAVVETVLEEVDDLLVGDIDDGSTFVEEAARWFKPIAPSATCLKVKDGSNPLLRRLPRGSPWGRRSATIAKNIMLKAQGQAAKLRWHLAPSSLHIHQVRGLLLVLIDSIRLLPHVVWLSIIFFHVWVIVDLLYPIARVCSKSFYLRFVEICR
jgi:hypothetical protein